MGNIGSLAIAILLAPMNMESDKDPVESIYIEVFMVFYALSLYKMIKHFSDTAGAKLTLWTVLHLASAFIAVLTLILIYDVIAKAFR